MKYYFAHLVVISFSLLQVGTNCLELPAEDTAVNAAKERVSTCPDNCSGHGSCKRPIIRGANDTLNGGRGEGGREVTALSHLLCRKSVVRAQRGGRWQRDGRWQRGGRLAGRMRQRCVGDAHRPHSTRPWSQSMSPMVSTPHRCASTTCSAPCSPP